MQTTSVAVGTPTGAHCVSVPLATPTWSHRPLVAVLAHVLVHAAALAGPLSTATTTMAASTANVTVTAIRRIRLPPQVRPDCKLPPGLPRQPRGGSTAAEAPSSGTAGRRRPGAARCRRGGGGRRQRRRGVGWRRGGGLRGLGGGGRPGGGRGLGRLGGGGRGQLGVQDPAAERVRLGYGALVVALRGQLHVVV